MISPVDAVRNINVRNNPEFRVKKTLIRFHLQNPYFVSNRI
jgi:hypothetical protein